MLRDAACCKGQSAGQRLCLPLLLGVSLLPLLLMSCQADPINHTVSVVVDPNNETIWGYFNLTLEQVNRIRTGTRVQAGDETTQATKKGQLDYAREFR